MAKGRDLSPDQASPITFGNWGYNNHMVWKRKGLFVTLDLLPKSSIKTGQWFKKFLGRWVTVALGYNILQLGLTKHLSILSRMRLVTGLLLVHIYFGPAKPKSKKLQLSNHSLNSKALFRLNYKLHLFVYSWMAVKNLSLTYSNSISVCCQ